MGDDYIPGDFIHAFKTAEDKEGFLQILLELLEKMQSELAEHRRSIEELKDGGLE
jgi:hypothetical protein